MADEKLGWGKNICPWRDAAKKLVPQGLGWDLGFRAESKIGWSLFSFEGMRVGLAIAQPASTAQSSQTIVRSPLR